MKEFELASLKVSSGYESIELKPEPGSHGWIVIGDDPVEDIFTVRSESAFANIPAFTGTLGGIEVTGFYLYWGDTDESCLSGAAYFIVLIFFSPANVTVIHKEVKDGDLGDSAPYTNPGTLAIGNNTVIGGITQGASERKNPLRSGSSEYFLKSQ